LVNSVVARAIINHGLIVPAETVRTYEFTNYYDLRYDPPSDDNRIRVEAQMRLHAESEYEHEYILQIGAQSQQVRCADERPINLTLCLDVSGSMSGMSMHLLKKVSQVIAGKLKEGDVVSMVTWNQQPQVVLNGYQVSGPCDPGLLEAIDALYTSGTTNMHDGLVKAYQLAQENYNAQHLNRVVVISDGGLNTGITDLDIISQYAQDSEHEGIYLVAVGVGDAAYYYYDDVMDTISDAGKGSYVFIDSLDEAARQFGWGFMRTMEIAALDVRVELTVPYYLLMHHFYGEQYSTNPDEVEPQHLGPNDAMIFHQYMVACDPELMNLNDAIEAKATYIDPFTHEAKSSTFTKTVNEMLAAPSEQLLKGDAIVAYAEALKQIDGLMYSQPEEALAVCQAALAKVTAAQLVLNDVELAEIVELLAKYAATIQVYIDLLK